MTQNAYASRVFENGPQDELPIEAKLERLEMENALLREENTHLRRALRTAAAALKPYSSPSSLNRSEAKAV